MEKAILTSWVAIASVTVDKIAHATNGTKSITISGSVTAPTETSFEGLKTSGSKSVSLDTINRVSTVTATAANIGSKTTIAISRVTSSFTHTLTYSFGGLTGTIATKTTSTSVSWTVPTTFYAKIPSAKTGVCTITCDTYSGSTKIGSSTCTFTATASASACSPSVSVTAVDTNSDIIALTGSNKKIVAGLSNVKATATATGKNSASISTVSISCGSTTKKATEVTFTKATSATVKATATDSRGYSTTATASGLTLISYIAPTISATYKRPTPTSDVVNVTVKGKWFNGSFGSVTNTLTAEVGYKPSSQADYTELTGMALTVDGNGYTATATISGLTYTEAYNVRIRISDAVYKDNGIKSAVVKDVVLRGTPVFDWGENDFQFNVPVILPKSVYFDENPHGGLNVNNSDITGLNNLLFYDKSGGPGESIRFYRDGTNWDCLYVIDGVVYITPNFPANTASYVLFSPANKPYYEAGDTVNLNTLYTGWVSGGSKEFYLSIPLSKPILGNVTVSGQIVGRGINGYVLNSNATRLELGGGTGYKVVTVKEENGLKIAVVFDEAQTAGIVNNTPINWYGPVTLTIS